MPNLIDEKITLPVPPNHCMRLTKNTLSLFTNEPIFMLLVNKLYGQFIVLRGLACLWQLESNIASTCVSANGDKQLMHRLAFYSKYNGYDINNIGSTSSAIGKMPHEDHE